MQAETPLNAGLLWNPDRDEQGQHLVLKFRTNAEAATAENALFFARLLSTSCAVRPREETDEIRRRRAAKVVKAEEGSVILAFPAANFTGQVADILLSAYVDLNSDLYRFLELTDFSLPEGGVAHFEHAPYGANLSQIYARPQRPLVIGVVKPSQGLSPAEHVDLTVDAFRGGCDVVKDDENLLPGDAENPFLERTSRLGEMLGRLRDELQRPLLYVANIQSDTEADACCRHLDSIDASTPPMFGALVSPILGLPNLRRLRRLFTGPLFCHSTGIGLLISGSFRLSRHAYIKLLRLSGIDAIIHAPPFARKWQCSPEVACRIRDWCVEPFDDVPGMLLTFGGGLGAENYRLVHGLMGKYEFGYLVGGAIFAHPQGPAAGARDLIGAVEEVALSSSRRITGV